MRNGFTPIITQTFVQELGYGVDHGASAKKRKIAEIALVSLREWGVQPLVLKPVGNGICDVIVDVIAGRKLLPEDERHDAYILIEAGMANVSMLITWHQHLLAASNSALNEVLVSFDLHPVQVTAPKMVLGY